jgi:hypothetical protein
MKQTITRDLKKDHRMKKKLYLLALLWLQPLSAIDQYTNQTIMFPKDIFGSFGMDQASWHNIVYNKQAHGNAFQVYGYAQTSIADPSNPKYFLFNFLDNIVVQNGKDPYNEESFTRDMLGAWIGIQGTTPYQASYTLTPQQSQYGATFGFSQDLSSFFDVALLRNISFNFSIPVIHVKNQLIFEGDSTILHALQGDNAASMGLNEAWNYLILDDQVQEKTGIGYFKFQFSSKYQSEDDVQVATTTFVLFPATNPVDNYKLFEPIIGYNGHTVLGSGITFQFPLSVSADKLTRICLYFGVENKFLLGNNQDRTLEMKEKPYSRYMPLYDRHTGFMVPGVNVFTKNCLVEPFNIINFIGGIRYKYKDSVTEFGYELWGKDTEKISLTTDDPWQENRYGIANIDENGQLSDSDIKTASQSTINYVQPDTENTYIKLKDITRMPAGARAALLHRAYVSLGYGQNTNKTDMFCNGGLFMEVTQNNAAMSNWGGWIKAGLTF